jgi:hypothetical protein
MRNIPAGQLIGSCIEYFLWFCAGLYTAWIRPRRLRRQVETGKISEQQRQASLKKFSPFLGYLVMLAAFLFLLRQFF